MLMLWGKRKERLLVGFGDFKSFNIHTLLFINDKTPIIKKIVN